MLTLSIKSSDFCFKFFLFIHLISASSAIAQSAVYLKISDAEGKSIPFAIVHSEVSHKDFQANEAGAVTILQNQFPVTVYQLGFEKALISSKQVLGLEEFIVTLNANQYAFNEIEIVGNNITGTNTQTIERLNNEYLRRNNQGNLAQTMALLPGVNAINVGTGIGKPIIRGLSFNRIMVNEGGIKQEGQQWGSDHGLEIDPFTVENVEILKGPAALIYGSDAVGGVVNIKSPSFPTKNTFIAEASPFYKSNNQLYGLTTKAGINLNDKFFLARFTLQEYADFSVPADSFFYNRFKFQLPEGNMRNTAGRERHLYLSGGLIKDWGSIRLNFSRYYQENGIFAGAVGIPRAYNLSDDGNKRGVDYPSAYVEHYKLSKQSIIDISKNLNLEWNLGVQSNLRRELSRPEAHILNGPIPTDPLAIGLTLNTATTNLQLKHLHQNLTFTYGLNGQSQSNKRSGFQFLLPDFSASQAGIFSVAEWVNNNFKANFGLRSDYSNVILGGYQELLYSNPTTVIGSRERSPFAFREYLNYAFGSGIGYQWKGIHFDLNFGRSFKNPGPSELGSNGIHHGTFRHEIGDINLNPEVGYQTDLSVKFQNQIGTFQFTPYYNYFENFIFLRPTARFSFLPEGGQIYQYSQTRAAYVGFESSFKTVEVKGLSLNLGTDYVHSTNLNTGLGMPFTPPLRGIVGLNYEQKAFSKHNFYLGLTNIFIAQQTNTDLNEQSTIGAIQGNFQAGLTLKTKRKINPTFRLEVQNLYNNPYFNHLSRYRWVGLPEQGRNFIFSVSLPLEAKLHE